MFVFRKNTVLNLFPAGINSFQAWANTDFLSGRLNHASVFLKICLQKTLLSSQIGRIMPQYFFSSKYLVLKYLVNLVKNIFAFWYFLFQYRLPSSQVSWIMPQYFLPDNFTLTPGHGFIIRDKGNSFARVQWIFHQTWIQSW